MQRNKQPQDLQPDDAAVSHFTEPRGAATTQSEARMSSLIDQKIAATHKKKSPWVFLAVVLVALALIGGFIWWFMDSSQDAFYDKNSILGQAPYKTQEEVQAELDRLVEEGMLNISIASSIEFDEGTAPGTAYIENVPNNHYAMKVSITLNDTGEVVYESGGIKPGNFIETITLTKDLDAGTYPATATFSAFDINTMEEVGQAGANISLIVKG